MTDFHDLLERASTPTTDWLADHHELLREGRRRVRRRRLAVSAVACAAALVVAGIALRTTAGHSGDETRVAGPTSYADLDLTPLTTAQVEARCVWRLQELGLQAPYSIRAGTPHQTSLPWHVGSTVLATRDGGRNWTACTVPESNAKPTPLDLTADASRLPQMCGDYLGIDLSGWQPLAVAADGEAEDGLFRSGNGYIADCYAQHTSLGIQRNAGVDTEGAWFGSSVCSVDVARQVDCYGDGRVADHAATEVDVTLPSGRVVRRPAVDGYWAIAVRDDASRSLVGQAQPALVARAVG